MERGRKVAHRHDGTGARDSYSFEPVLRDLLSRVHCLINFIAGFKICGQ